MKTAARCSVCLLKLAHTAADAAGASEEKRMKAVRETLKVLAADDFSRVPPAIAGDVLAAISTALETPDPFAAIKAEHDRKAMAVAAAWAPGFLAGAANDDDRLDRALRAALVGNSMDLATMPDDADLARFDKWLAAPYAVDHRGLFRADLADTADVLYLCDNAGEIAFDRYLIEEFLRRGKRVTVSVKGGPAMNDATLDDARLVGLDRLPGSVRLITTGQAFMGVDPKTASAEWRAAFERAGLVLAKGQANLECLHDAGRAVYFLTLIKCTHVSDYYRLPKGSAMLYRGGRENGTPPAF
jgi:hypothetical protein